MSYNTPPARGDIYPMDQPHTIAIQEMLSIIRSTAPGGAPFLLRVVKSQGRDRGRIYVLPRCLYGVPEGRPLEAPSGEQPKKEAQKKKGGRGYFSWKDHDMLPIIDLEAAHGRRLLTIPISHIIGYNDKQVRH